jgi:hypothetical protein
MTPKFIPELTRLGVDILDPIQPADDHMQPERLKAEYGGRLAFHSGIDMQNLLPMGAPVQVASKARRYCEILGAGDGYILVPAHLQRCLKESRSSCRSSGVRIALSRAGDRFAPRIRDVMRTPGNPVPI